MLGHDHVTVLGHPVAADPSAIAGAAGEGLSARQVALAVSARVLAAVGSAVVDSGVGVGLPRPDEAHAVTADHRTVLEAGAHLARHQRAKPVSAGTGAAHLQTLQGVPRLWYAGAGARAVGGAPEVGLVLVRLTAQVAAGLGAARLTAVGEARTSRQLQRLRDLMGASPQGHLEHMSAGTGSHGVPIEEQDPAGRRPDLLAVDGEHDRPVKGLPASPRLRLRSLSGEGVHPKLHDTLAGVAGLEDMTSGAAKTASHLQAHLLLRAKVAAVPNDTSPRPHKLGHEGVLPLDERRVQHSTNSLLVCRHRLDRLGRLVVDQEAKLVVPVRHVASGHDVHHRVEGRRPDPASRARLRDGDLGPARVGPKGPLHGAAVPEAVGRANHQGPRSLLRLAFPNQRSLPGLAGQGLLQTCLRDRDLHLAHSSEVRHREAHPRPRGDVLLLEGSEDLHDGGPHVTEHLHGRSLRLASCQQGHHSEGAPPVFDGSRIEGHVAGVRL